VTVTPPNIPWQITGNHWLTVPCIHPADASIHLIGALHAQSRAAIEFAGSPEFLEGRGAALARLVIVVNDEPVELAGGGINWERESGWLPTFSSKSGDLIIRGTIVAPHGRNADVAGIVIAVTIENRGSSSIELTIGLTGTLGHRQMRVRTGRAFADGHSAFKGSDHSIVLEGKSAESPLALAIGGEGDFSCELVDGNTPGWTLDRKLSLGAGEIHEAAFHIAAGPERDGAAAVLGVMRRRGSRALISATRSALREMEPGTGNASVDRLIARHLFFAYFCSIARALDDAHVYVVRSRIPWNGQGITIRDWHALMWVLPAVQLADQSLARELLLRVCELHGYAPGNGVHYVDGSLFEPGFSLEGAAAYAIAVDAYIVQTSDDKVVEEPVLADSLYGSHDDMEVRKHATLPLYSTEVNPDGSVPARPYTAHGNAVVALALDVLRHTLDEKTAEKVQDSAAVRAALMRQFTLQSDASKAMLASQSDLAGVTALEDEPSASMYWLPFYELLNRDDSLYRRTVKRIESVETEELVVRCAQLIGPNGAQAFEWLRRAPLDNGFAAEVVDQDGRAVGNGGDAAMSGLIAYLVWYSSHALGLKA
jgi:hypothetical protein